LEAAVRAKQITPIEDDTVARTAASNSGEWRN